uniref:Protein kinase domain-containing protein n=1 Tax=Strongyloides venezuelensis TaxID=75913 RepID=A0A0K0EW63_STRVS
MTSISEGLRSIEDTQNTISGDFVKKDKYDIQDVLRQGEFSIIRLCEDKNKTLRIIKFVDEESYKAEMELTEHHIKTIRSVFDYDEDIKKFNRFNNIIDHGYLEGTKSLCIVYEKLGENLNEIRIKYKDCKMDKFDAMVILHDSLNIINYLHNIGYVHRSIKPSTFCHRYNPKISKNYRPIVMTNFETCCKIVDKKDSKFCPKRITSFGRKNIKYCSISQHEKEKIYFPSDDIESWFYIGVLLFEGSLPWFKEKTNKDKDIIKGKKRLRELGEGICYDKTPNFFRNYCEYFTKDSEEIDCSVICHELMQMIHKFSSCSVRRTDLFTDERSYIP